MNQTQPTQLPSDCQDTPLSDEALALFPQFIELLRSRMEAGKQSYGDSSFSRPLPQIPAEISMELVDVAGWSFIAWVRLQLLMRAVESLDRMA